MEVKKESEYGSARRISRILVRKNIFLDLAIILLTSFIIYKECIMGKRDIF